MSSGWEDTTTVWDQGVSLSPTSPPSCRGTSRSTRKPSDAQPTASNTSPRERSVAVSVRLSARSEYSVGSCEVYTSYTAFYLPHCLINKSLCFLAVLFSRSPTLYTSRAEQRKKGVKSHQRWCNSNSASIQPPPANALFPHTSAGRGKKLLPPLALLIVPLSQRNQESTKAASRVLEKVSL